MVNFLLFLRFLMLLPVNDIFVSSITCHLSLRHDFGDKVPDREYNIVTESWLLLGHNSGRPVAQEARAHIIRFFHITLHEELIEQEVRPFSQRLKLACWC